MKGTTKSGDAKAGGFCVTAARVAYETSKREKRRRERNNVVSTGTTCHLGSSDYIIYKVGSDEAVADRLTFCSI